MRAAAQKSKQEMKSSSKIRQDKTRSSKKNQIRSEESGSKKPNKIRREWLQNHRVRKKSSKKKHPKIRKKSALPLVQVNRKRRYVVKIVYPRLDLLLLELWLWLAVVP